MAEAIQFPSPSSFLRPSPALPSAPQSTVSKHVRRPSRAETKKKAPRKSGVVGTDAVGGFEKPKQTKSRNGCWTCKTKRLKCGEEKPVCRSCVRRGWQCGGYKKDYKWRAFEETNVGIQVEKQRRGTSPNRAPAESSKTPPQQVASPKTVESPRPATQAEQAQKHAADLPFGSGLSRPGQQSQPVERGSISPTSELPDSPLPPLLVDETPSIPTIPTTRPELQPRSVSPTLSDLLLPFELGNTDYQEGSQDHLSDRFQGPPSDDVMDLSLIGDDLNDEEIEEVTRNDRSMHELTHQDVLRQLAHSVPPQPAYEEDVLQMLSVHFITETCGILSMMDGASENPWRSLVLPLTEQSPALFHAVTAMTAYHAARDVPELRLLGHEHKAASCRLINEGLRDHSIDDQTAIATALALGFAEAWDQPTTSGNAHIKGAQALVRRALEEHQMTPLSGDDLKRLKFLCNAWVYMDVIARLTSVDSDESNDFDNAFIFSDDTRDCPPLVFGDVRTQPGFGIDFGMPIDARLDPLMGCANTLFPLIGRVANLVRKVCRTEDNSLAIISEARDLQTALEEWRPPTLIERPQDPTTLVRHTVRTAIAYREATLLHLRSAIPELSFEESSAQLSQKLLKLLLAPIPLWSRTIIVHIYPLMVAGCEAKTDEDRNWVRGRWAAMGDRMKIGTIEKCLTVTEEVWMRRDTYERQPPSSRKLVATTDLHPTRPNEQPFARALGDYRLPVDPGLHPGRLGKVFSLVQDASGSNGRQSKGNTRQGTPDNRHKSDPVMETDPAYSVRGHLHWVGVMWDWKWEILLG